MDESIPLASFIAPLLTVIASVAAALLAGYLVDSRWIKERRLDAYAAVMSEVQTSIQQHKSTGLENEQVKQMTIAFNDVTLLAPKITSQLLDKAWLKVSKLKDPDKDEAKYDEIVEAMSDFLRQARTDVLRWRQRRT